MADRNLVRVVSQLDGLMARLRVGDEDAIDDAKMLLHAIVGASSAGQLCALLIPVSFLFNREVSSQDDLPEGCLLLVAGLLGTRGKDT